MGIYGMLVGVHGRSRSKIVCRTQWLKRLVELSDAHQLTVQLPYYPPYQSKYNPVERLWRVLENH